METGALRNFKDFLQLYNQMTENCFRRCIDNINSRSLEKNEIECVEHCASKFIKYNNKLMTNFVQAQNVIVNKRIQDAEEKNKAMLKNSSMDNVKQELPQAVSSEVLNQEIAVAGS